MHEGFCVPIVEAMYHGVPVVAVAEAAVPETVGNAGLLVESSDPALLATALNSVLCDKDLYALLARRGTERASELSLTNSRATMRRALEGWVAGRGSFGATRPPTSRGRVPWSPPPSTTSHRTCRACEVSRS